ncbi:MAG TPA: hypothetical protein VM661_08390 [Candidatus Sulfotelmatobacter sp.]|jgi:hypothetical protein|nr:hypothetical protein [Candidatus Sulfotelmatobacter sp.]
MDGALAVVGFKNALEEVSSTIEAFEKAKSAEGESQKAKNTALYLALERAFQFHDQWAGTPEYEELLSEKSINAKPRGKGASVYLPTIKVFFDPALDSFEPSNDDEKADKNRRQKMVSTYSRVLEYAASNEEGSKNVAAFIQQQGGVEAARAAWKEQQDNTDEAKEKAQSAELSRFGHYQTGLELLKGSKSQTLPQLETLKDSVQLAALYVDENGVSHFLGMLPETDSSKKMLERFIRDADPASHKAAERPITALHKLLRLLMASKAAHASDASIKIVNGPDRCELWSSHGSTQTCMLHAVLATQDYLPEGAYWFNAKAIKALQYLAKLGRHGAEFTINGPAELNGKMASVYVTIANHKDAILAFDKKAGMPTWDWRDAIPSEDSRRRSMNADGTTSIEYRSPVEQLVTATSDIEWATEIPVEGGFEKWLDQTFCQTASKVDDRLATAAYGANNNKHTILRMNGADWSLKDKDGEFAGFQFSDGVPFEELDNTFTTDCGDIRRALQETRALAPDALATIAIREDAIRVQRKSGGQISEVFIPALVSGKRAHGFMKIEASPLS